MSRLSKCDRCLDRCEVSHFSDDNDIRIFTKNRSDTIRKCVKLLSKLTLMNQGFFILIDKFDWIFEGDNMALGITVDMFYHCCHRRRLTTSRRTSNEYDSFFCKCKIEKMFRKTDRLRFRNRRWDHTESDRSSTNHTRNIYAKSGSNSLKRNINRTIMKWSSD